MKGKIKEFLLEEFPGDIHEKNEKLFLQYLEISITKLAFHGTVVRCDEEGIDVHDFESSKKRIRCMFQQKIIRLQILEAICSMDEESFISLRKEEGCYCFYSGDLFFRNEFLCFWMEMETFGINDWYVNVTITRDKIEIKEIEFRGAFKDIKKDFLPSILKGFKIYTFGNMLKNEEKDITDWLPFALGYKKKCEVILEDVDREYAKKEFYRCYKKRAPNHLPQVQGLRIHKAEPEWLGGIKIEKKDAKCIVRNANLS